MITIQGQDKIRIAKSGAQQLFGIDYNTRQSMNNQELIEMFDLVWCIEIEQLILDGYHCKYEEILKYLTQEYQQLIDPDQEFRRFRYRKTDFIAQLKLNNQGKYCLTQLLKINSLDIHSQKLEINFSSFEEKELFQSLATNLKMDEQVVGLKLVRLFMNLAYDAIENDDAQALACLDAWLGEDNGQL
jgi:hypothetical protein